MNGVVAQEGATNYSSILLPRIGLELRVPLTERVALLTGADLQQKGFKSQRTRFDTSGLGSAVRTAANATVCYSQINIPLQVSVRMLRKEWFDLELSGGMSYGFMLAATAVWDYSTYYPNGARDDYGSRNKLRISLLPYSNRLSPPNPNSYGALFLFNPAFAGSVTLKAREKLLLQLYGEYNLYDAASLSYDLPINLYSLGACVGYRF